MDDDQSMDSFVDIVANTVGIVIILTMLTIMGIDKRALEVDDELQSKMNELATGREDIGKIASDILGKSKALMASGADLGLKNLDIDKMDRKAALAEATDLIKRMDAIREKSEAKSRELDLAKLRRNDAEAKHDQEKKKLTDLRARKKSLTDAMRTRDKVEAELVTDLPGFNKGKFERTSLTSLKKEVDDLQNKISDIEKKSNMSRDKFMGLQKEVERLTKEKADVDEKLSKYREVTGLEIEIPRPPSLSEQMKLPVFFECFSKPSAEGAPADLRVRFIGPGAEDEGEPYRSIADPASEFSRFLAEQTEEFKASRRLHFIVRPDAGAAFRKARKAASEAGWTVGWNPIGKDVDLKIGAATSETTTASARTPAFAAPR